MYYPKQVLAGFCAGLLSRAGVGAQDAAQIADVLTEADARGVYSHGVVRVEGYMACVQSGGIRPNAVHTVVAEGPGFARIDAGQGLGIPVSLEATELAIRKAKQTGIALVTVFNSHHHGACGHYTLMCARQGLIGLAMSTGDIIMAATGSAESSIGNNPFSYAVPAGAYGEICYDVAMSTVAAGKIAMAADEGRSIPLGWLLDPDGNPTTDPGQQAKGGPLVPFGGYKGYGLSLMVETLAGMLSGGALLKDIHAWNKDPEHSGNVGHCFAVIDPALVSPGIDIAARAEHVIAELKASRRAPGVDRICFPGELEQEKLAISLARGIALPPASEHALARAAALVGLTFDAQALAFGSENRRF